MLEFREVTEILRCDDGVIETVWTNFWKTSTYEMSVVRVSVSGLKVVEVCGLMVQSFSSIVFELRAKLYCVGLQMTKPSETVASEALLATFDTS